MPIPASSLFDFLDEHPSCAIERYEVSSPVFSALRRNIRSLIISFCETDDQNAHDIAGGLRMLISEWLTVPIRFDNSMSLFLESMGEGPQIGRRWGDDIRAVFEEARSCAVRIQQLESPLRNSLASSLRDLVASDRSFRIYCHPQARQHFASIDGIPGNVFLHSVVQYRNAEPFEVLVKVGPLRSRGWGCAPDAILTAPRFDTLTQFVWTGCTDEAGFGYDPVSAPLPAGEPGIHAGGIAEASAPALRIGWKTTPIHTQADAGDNVPEVPDVRDADEFELFTNLNSGGDLRRSVLLQLDAETGILHPPHSRTLSFDPAKHSVSPIDQRISGETLSEGMFLIIPWLNDNLLNGLQAEEGYYSRIWKKRLSEELMRDDGGLMQRLRSGGLDLRVLRSRVEHWCKPATTVIHAPQQMCHFEILIGVLGVDFDPAVPAGKGRAPWWKYAWDEVRRARGEAIHTGFHDQQIEDEQVTSVLQTLVPEIRARAASQDRFEIAVPPGQSVAGTIRFFRILMIEDGYLAPSGDLGIIHELSTINQWRI